VAKSRWGSAPPKLPRAARNLVGPVSTLSSTSGEYITQFTGREPLGFSYVDLADVTVCR
jgi:hypothetical protein